jgi:hypothetical protein
MSPRFTWTRRTASPRPSWCSAPVPPVALQHRLDKGLSLRDPPIPRPSGSIGGLGLAIAQRVALLHGGSLRPLPAPEGGTRMSLALPLAA